ncbi:MAG: PaaI family thioesterase [Fibrobacter sp.]|nr:PaaI family thioesterase [Fibrobacter sp.]
MSEIFKVVSKLRNSKMCMICGLDNEYGVRAPFYNMEDGSVMTLFQYREQHQSYPGRVHGGLITAMLDEMGLRAVWAKEGGNEDIWGVTMSLETKYRKPVPYNTPIIGKGVITKFSSRFFVTHASILDLDGNVLADGDINYLHLDPKVIASGAVMHEEMPYLIEDGVKEISIG